MSQIDNGFRSLGVDARFAAFYEAHYGSTKRLAYLLSGSLASAEDVAHDAFTAVYPRFADLDYPVRYLRTVTVNLCRRDWRRRSGERARVALLEADGISPPPESIELLSAVRTLNSRQQAVLVLRYWNRLSEAEVAAILECPIGTVKTLHHRALAVLRKEFA